jgi:Na+/proline symporter
MQPSSAASLGFGYFYANHFYPKLMNNSLIAKLHIMRKIYSFHMVAGKEDTNT